MKLKLSYTEESKSIVANLLSTEFIGKCFYVEGNQQWLKFTEKEFLDKISVLAKFLDLEITHCSEESCFTLHLKKKQLK